MNLPAFCKFLGEIHIKEVDVGSSVLDVTNSQLLDDDLKFTYDMTGTEMYIHYKRLPPNTRVKLDELELLSNNEWQHLVKQTDYLNIGLNYSNSKKEFYMFYIYTTIVGVCLLLAIMAGITYVMNVRYHDDALESHILDGAYRFFEIQDVEGQ